MLSLCLCALYNWYVYTNVCHVCNFSENTVDVMIVVNGDLSSNEAKKKLKCLYYIVFDPKGVIEFKMI